MTEPTGKKQDTGKRRWSLLPLEAVGQVVDVLEYGAVKYGAGNWKLVPNAKDRYWDAAIRHLIAWRMGQQRDPETPFNHLAHAMCSILFLLSFDEGFTPPPLSEEEQQAVKVMQDELARVAKRKGRRK